MQPMPALDGLRAVAVSLVLLQHYLGEWPLVRRVGPGGLGVGLFFVLSGFLITRILLDLREHVAAGAQTLGGGLRAFYARRFLRIVPLYYAVLLAAAALDVPPVRRTFAWHAAYLSNLYFARRGAWDGPVTPFWSLAIEEQFYLLWPLVILCVPPRWLLRAVVAVLALCPLARLAYLRVLDTGPFAVGMLPFGCTDQLVWGALLGCCWHDPDALDLVRRRVRAAGWWVGAPLVLLFPWLGPAAPGSAAETLTLMLQLTAGGVCFFAVVDAVARGVPGPVGRVLEARAPRYLGKISYGVYVQHTFVRTLAFGLGALPGLAGLGRWLRGVERHEAWWFPFATATVIATASLSWYLLEKPINELKGRFPYVRSRAPTAG